MLKIGSLVLGVRDVPRAIRFWSTALNYRPREEPSDDWAVLIPRDAPGSQLAIKMVSSKPETHQRHHLDLYANDQRVEVERLIELGAQQVEWQYPADADYVVLADPDGNRFGVVQTPSEV